MLKYCLFFVGFLCFLNMDGQDSERVATLKADLNELPVGDTQRIRIMAKLWRAYKYNDLETAASYGYRMVEEAERFEDIKWRAAAYQCIASTLDYQGKADSALGFYWSALSIYGTLGDDRLRGVTSFNIASLYLYNNTPYSADHYLARADTFFTAGQHVRQLAAVRTQRAAIARSQGRFDDGLQQALIGLEMAMEAEDSLAITDAVHEVSLAYDALANYSEAIRYLKQNIAYARGSHNKYNEMTDLATLGSIYQSAGQRDSAYYFLGQAEALLLDKNFTAAWPMLGYSMGNLLYEDGRKEEALRYFRLGERYAGEDSEGADRVQTLRRIAEILLERKQVAEAKRYASSALKIAEQSPRGFSHLEATHALLSKIAAVAGRSGEALDYLRQARRFTDSLQRVETLAAVARLTTDFEKQKQVLIIERQSARLESLNNQARADRLQRLALIGGILALLALLATGWYSYRQRHQRQELEKARLADELITHQKELSAHALQMAQKGQLLDQLGEELRQIKGERPDDRKKLDGMLRELSSEERIDQDWANFRTYFQGVHGDFEDRLKAIAKPALSPRELRLSALIKMQLTNQEVGTILGVTQDSLYKAKYRLRKKLPGAGEGELDAFLAAF